VGDKGEGALDQEKAGGEEKEETEDKIHQGLPSGGEACVQDVHPYVVALEVGIPCRHQEKHGEEMPLQLLNEDEAGVESVAEKHIGSGDDHHDSCKPGGGTAHAVIDLINPPDQSEREDRQGSSAFAVLKGFGPVHYCSMSLKKAVSSRILIPSSLALVSLEPGSAPATT